MRAGVVLAVVLLLGGCRAGSDAGPPVVQASEPVASEIAEERLVALRATDQFDEFADHERAARADGARLAWENFAPIVDGERVEWTNKAELWDAIAPAIRDEALLLGPEYREPLWDNANAIPNGVSMAWNNEDTEGRGDYVQFTATYQAGDGPSRRYWGALIDTSIELHGTVRLLMPPIDTTEAQFQGEAQEAEAVAERQWVWIQQQEVQQ